MSFQNQSNVDPVLGLSPRVFPFGRMCKAVVVDIDWTKE